MKRKSKDQFLLLDSDPNHKNNKRVKYVNRGKYKKVLTNVKPSGIIKPVKKLIRKDDKTMAHDKNKKANKYALLSAAWLIEAAFRAFVGWVLLSNFDNLATTAAAFYALGTAGLIVATHFVRAHKG